MKFNYLLIAILVSFIGCKKEDLNSSYRVDRIEQLSQFGNADIVTQYFYDNLGRVTGYEVMIQGQSPITHEYHYDGKSNRITQTTYGTAGVTATITHTYNGDLRSTSIYKDINGTPTETVSYEYDKEDQLLKKERFGKDGTLIQRVEYSNHIGGNPLKSVTYQFSPIQVDTITTNHIYSSSVTNPMHMIEPSHPEYSTKALEHYAYAYGLNPTQGWLRKSLSNSYRDKYISSISETREYLVSYQAGGYSVYIEYTE